MSTNCSRKGLPWICRRDGMVSNPSTCSSEGDKTHKANKRPREQDPEQDFFERAYVNSLVPSGYVIQRKASQAMTQTRSASVPAEHLLPHKTKEQRSQTESRTIIIKTDLRIPIRAYQTIFRQRRKRSRYCFAFINTAKIGIRTGRGLIFSHDGSQHRPNKTSAT